MQKHRHVILIALALTAIIGSILIINRKPRPVPIARFSDAYYAIFDPSGGNIVTIRDGLVNRKARPNIVVWSLETGEPIATFDPYAVPYEAIFSPDGTYLITLSTDTKAEIWDTATWEVIDEIKASGLGGDIDHHPTQDLLALSRSGTGKRAKGLTVLLNPQTGEEVAALEWPPFTSINTAFSPDGEQLAVSSCRPDETPIVQIWRIAGMTLTREFTPPDGVTDLAWSPDGLYLVAGSADSQIFEGCA